jgi:hypothetical protein
MESGNGKEVPLSSNAEEVIRQLYTGVQYLIESQKKDSSNWLLRIWKVNDLWLELANYSF